MVARHEDRPNQNFIENLFEDFIPDQDRYYGEDKSILA